MRERRRDDPPLASEADRTEQQRGLFDDLDDDTPVPDGVDPADARDQQVPVRYDDSAEALPDGVDPADAHDQQQAVRYDEDDYR